MLAANVCASDFLRKRKQPMLYRIHEGPTPEKLAALREFLKGFGLALARGRHAAREGLREAARARERPARRAAHADGHAALAAAGGVQPRQRRPFRARLRVVHAFHLADPALSGPARAPRDQGFAAEEALRPGDWHALGAHCSMTERRADEATRDVDNWLKCYYMRDRVGETFNGSVSARHRFRRVRRARRSLRRRAAAHLRARQGLLPLRSDQARAPGRAHEASATASATACEVKVVRVDLDTTKIDFVLA